MKTIITNYFLIVLSLTQPVLLSAQGNNDPFTAPSSSSSRPPSSLCITYSFDYHRENYRLSLNWSIDNNQDVYQFEIENSTDGINFSMAALLFGTNKADIEQYKFYEKVQSHKIYYRVKIVSTDQSSRYSDMVQCILSDQQKTELEK